MLVLLFVLTAVVIASGVILLAARKRARAFIHDVRTHLFGEKWADRQPMINTPIVGGIGMIAIGIVLIVVLVTEGSRAVQ